MCRRAGATRPPCAARSRSPLHMCSSGSSSSPRSPAQAYARFYVLSTAWDSLYSQQSTYSSVLILCVVSAAASGRDPPAAGRVLAVGGQVLAARSRRQAAHWARRADHSDRIRARRRTHASSPLSKWYTTLVDYSFCRLRNLLKC